MFAPDFGEHHVPVMLYVSLTDLIASPDIYSSVKLLESERELMYSWRYEVSWVSSGFGSVVKRELLAVTLMLYVFRSQFAFVGPRTDGSLVS